MEEALIELLLEAPAVRELVDRRVYPQTRPQGSPLPAVTVQVISRQRSYHMTGSDGLVRSRVQVDAWGLTYEATKTLGRAVSEVLSGFSGTSRGVQFDGIFFENEDDGFDSGSNSQSGQPERYFRNRIDIITWHHGV